MKDEQLLRLALDNGAAKAAVIPQSAVVLSASFFDICKANQCGNFGKCWMCPPDVGPIEELMARVRAYPRGLLYQTIAPLEDSFDIEGMAAAGKAHAKVSQNIETAARAAGLADHFHLSAGGCRLCPRCAKVDDLPCRHPDRALPPMEGAGIDVYRTTKSTDLKYINGPNTVTYFGLLLLGAEG